MKTPPTIREAQCPRCKQWSPIAWDDAIPPGGWWWKDSAGCPECGYLTVSSTDTQARGAQEVEHEQAGWLRWDLQINRGRNAPLDVAKPVVIRQDNPRARKEF